MITVIDFSRCALCFKYRQNRGYIQWVEFGDNQNICVIFCLFKMKLHTAALLFYASVLLLFSFL